MLIDISDLIRWGINFGFIYFRLLNAPREVRLDIPTVCAICSSDSPATCLTRTIRLAILLRSHLLEIAAIAQYLKVVECLSAWFLQFFESFEEFIVSTAHIVMPAAQKETNGGSGQLSSLAN